MSSRPGWADRPRDTGRGAERTGGDGRPERTGTVHPTDRNRGTGSPADRTSGTGRPADRTFGTGRPTDRTFGTGRPAHRTPGRTADRGTAAASPRLSRSGGGYNRPSPTAAHQGDRSGGSARGAAVPGQRRGPATDRPAGTGYAGRQPRSGPPVGGPRRRVGSDPDLPADIEPGQLDPDVRRELRSLPKELADTVARHLVAAGLALDEDPQRALAHARAARRLAARVAPVREAVGVAAYAAGDWAEAISELRAVRRMTGAIDHLPLLADSERGLGRPERALDLAAAPEIRQLPPALQVEMRIVASGARRDLGQPDAAVVGLQGPDLDDSALHEWTTRLRYAYAEALVAAGRVPEARRWFRAVIDIDEDVETDAADRLAALGSGPEG